MATVNAERAEIIKRVGKAMRHPVARAPLASPGADRAQHVIACLRTDTVAHASERVAAAGGGATVVVPHRGGLLPLQWSNSNLSDAATPMHVESAVSERSELGMVVDYMDTTRDRDLTFQVMAGEAELVGGEPITVPA